MPTETLVIAHRGAWGDAGENTLEAFEQAIAVGADMIEFDVRRTRDGRLVVQHDPGPDGAPPLLEDVLELAKDRIDLDIELKEPGCTRDVVARLKRFGLERCLVTSFLDEVVLEAKTLAPELRAGLLIGTGSPTHLVRTRLSELFPVGRLLRCRADYVGVHVRLADAGALRRAASAGAQCLVWTVNEPARIDRYLEDRRVVGMITDVPQLALARRAGLM